jgi:DNA-directed RNA polymerase specialized sigma24 family protein
MSNDKGGSGVPGAEIDTWRRVIAEDGLSRLRMEDIVAALQGFDPKADPRVVNALMKHVADVLTRYLRKRVGRNHPNDGEDIIDRAHAEIIEAVLRPDSADGKGLRTAFFARAEFRLADAIREELKHGRREATADATELDEEGTIGPTATDSDLDSIVVVDELLSHLPDPRMALALRLAMDGCPIESKKGTYSIADALGVSSKTAGQLLAEGKRIVKLRIGERA